MKDIIISPQAESKKNEVERLRKTFIKLYTEKDRLLNEERDDLYVRYINLIGKYKYENFKLSVEVRAMKMKMEFAQAAINRNKRPAISEIEQEVSRRMEEYYMRVEEQARAIDEAKNAQGISSFDAEEMLQLFRMLVKRTHPDLHPNQSEEMKDHFLQGQTAYRSRNLSLLREIIMCLDVEEGIEEQLSSQGECMDDMISRLKSQIEEISKFIHDLKEEFPFNIRKKLLDPAWIKEQEEMLAKGRKELERQMELYKERYNLIVE